MCFDSPKTIIKTCQNDFDLIADVSFFDADKNLPAIFFLRFSATQLVVRGTQEIFCLEHGSRRDWNTGHVLIGTQDMS